MHVKCLIYMCHKSNIFHSCQKHSLPTKMLPKVTFGVLFIAAIAVSTSVLACTQFQEARDEIDRVKPYINYQEFCVQPTPGGKDKIACRIKNVKSVGFLVCKDANVIDEDTGESTPCIEVIATELGNLLTITNAGINTVEVNAPQIDGVMCGRQGSTSIECSGFLEEWISQDEGMFVQVRDRIVGGPSALSQLIAQISKDTKDLKKTATDLKTIRSYMHMADGTYRQICDLQGFFLKDGGFKVSDVPYIAKNLGLDEPCWTGTGEPTTKQVLDALTKMIDAFEKMLLKRLRITAIQNHRKH